MKVFSNEVGYVTSAVLHKIQLEDDKISEHRQADVIVGKPDGVKPSMSFECQEVPRVVVEAMGIPLVSGKPDWFITKRHKPSFWHEQTMIGVPLTTMMNENLGADAWAGCAMRFVHSTSYADFFKQPTVNEYFDSYSGFVSYGMNKNGLTNVWSGIPYWGMLNVMEAVKEKISDYIGSNSGLLESWTVNLAVSKAGYPERETTEEYLIDGITPEIEKHFWPFYPTQRRKALYTKSTLTGIVTAYSAHLNDAVSRVMRTCRNLDIPNKQYRTDALSATSRVWYQLGLA